MNIDHLMYEAAAEMRRERVIYWCNIISATSQALICAAVLGYIYGILAL